MANFKVRSKVVSMGGLRLNNTITDSITAAKLGASNNGEIRLGHSASGGTVQVGVVIEGTAYVLQGTVGGNLSVVAAP